MLCNQRDSSSNFSGTSPWNTCSCWGAKAFFPVILPARMLLRAPSASGIAMRSIGCVASGRPS